MMNVRVTIPSISFVTSIMVFYLLFNYITKIVIYFGITKYFPNFFSKKSMNFSPLHFVFVVAQKRLDYLHRLSNLNITYSYSKYSQISIFTSFLDPR